MARSSGHFGGFPVCGRPSRGRCTSIVSSLVRHGATELIRDPDVYRGPGEVEWASGACLLVRRTVLERLGGWDAGFFLYSEDVDLCRRAWSAGFTVRYEPSAHVVHEGGASAPRGATLPMLARSRLRYASLHSSAAGAFLERVGVALEELTRAVLTTGGAGTRAGHLRAVAVCLSLSRKRDSPATELGTCAGSAA